VLLTAQLMVILDITAVNIALPSLATDLGLSGSTVGWTITSYSLIFGSLLLFGGRLADLVGRRRMFMTGLGVFTVSSLASAMAGTAGALFAARAGQGLGAAMLSPAALSIVTTAFQRSQRAKALAAWGAVGGAGAAIGVLVGGVLTQVADWRLIFDVNLPVAIALAVTASRVLPATSRSRAGAASTCPVRCSPPEASASSSSRSRRRTAPVGARPRRSGSRLSHSSASPSSCSGSAASRSPSCVSSGWPIAPSAAGSS
jgi:MFS family permease